MRRERGDRKGRESERERTRESERERGGRGQGKRRKKGERTGERDTINNSGCNHLSTQLCTCSYHGDGIKVGGVHLPAAYPP